MAYRVEKLKTLVRLAERYAPQDGVNMTSLQQVGVFRASTTQVKGPVIEVPGIAIVGQGRKYCYVGNRLYEYSPGNVLIMFYPMAAEVEFVEASPDEPFLAAGIRADLARLADILLQIERVEGVEAQAHSPDPSGLFSVPLNDNLLDPMIRLFESLAHPTDAAILADAIVDEIYYRILSGERGGDLRVLLQQRGQIQRISKAVEYIHHNLDKPVSVEELAGMANMGRTSFYETFRDVMHLSPLQYAKSVKLDNARTLIKKGSNVTETSYLVGYNSPTQFSREYKRYFGFAPSAT